MVPNFKAGTKTAENYTVLKLYLSTLNDVLFSYRANTCLGGIQK